MRLEVHFKRIESSAQQITFIASLWREELRIYEVTDTRSTRIAFRPNLVRTTKKSIINP